MATPEAPTRARILALAVVPVPEGWKAVPKKNTNYERPVIALGLMPDDDGNPLCWEALVADGTTNMPVFASEAFSDAYLKGPNYYEASR